jgi:putative N6-adenine-specific DNA methylase
MFDPSHGMPLTATCSRGLEQVLADELLSLGAKGTRVDRGAVSYSGSLELIYRANLQLRTAMRVLLPLVNGPAANRYTLYDLSSGIAWEDLLERRQTIAVEAVGSSRHLRNTAYAAQVVKDGVVDRLRRCWGARPDVDRHAPDLRIHVHLAGQQATISLDSSGEPLSHRGYRPRGGPAPLAESLAAGILLLAGYDGTGPLLDPMCGTGTIAVEAALLATGTAPGLRRSFACERWSWHRPQVLEELRRQLEANVQPAPAPILARDHDRRAVAATRQNMAAAGVERWVKTACMKLADTESLAAGSMVICNPPYGHRLGETGELKPLYRELGDTLKRCAAGSTAWLLVGEPELAKEIHLRPSRRLVLFNGPIECRLLRFEMVEGSLRPDVS